MPEQCECQAARVVVTGGATDVIDIPPVAAEQAGVHNAGVKRRFDNLAEARLLTDL